MKILFVYDNMWTTGGVQTWLLRVLPLLRRQGHEVALLTRPRGEDWDDTSSFVDRLSEQVTVHIAGRHWFSDPRSVIPTLESVDLVFACNLEALLRAGVIQQRLMPSAKVVAGVFHAREYCWKAPRLQQRWRQHLSGRLVRLLPAENFMFSTDSMALQTGDCIGRDFGRSPVLRYPVDTDRLRPRPNRRVDRHKIVSVTRLSPYYTHHAQMIRVIRDLRAQGHPFTYHAYGDGEERGALERAARSLRVEDSVFFHGTLPYDEFADAMDDAFVYIGLGTALVEAAACGVPALVGIDLHPGPATYGFLHDTGSGAVGGHVPGHPEHDIAERVLWLAGISDDQYHEAEQASRASAEEFSADLLLPQFTALLEQASPCAIPVSARDRALGQLDWLLEAVLLKLGAPDTAVTRFVRRAPPPAA
jgi:glycosyltransferase involved in cell wall biosynthesis